MSGEKLIHGKYTGQGEDLSDVIKVRREIFGCGEDDADKDAVNLLVSLKDNARDTGEVVGTGRLLLDIDRFMFFIDFVGIIPEARRRGYGEFALRALVDKVSQCGAEKVYIEKEKINSSEAQVFFERMFFTPDEDERYLSAVISSFHSCCH